MSELKWGEMGESERDAARADLLAKLPPEAREGGERLLRACEQDFATATTTVTLMACISASRARPAELGYDVLKAALEFYRLASMQELAEHLLATGGAEADELRLIRAGLSTRGAAAGRRLRTLMENLQSARKEGQGDG